MPVSATNNATCATYGFAVDTAHYPQIGLSSYLTNYVYYDSTLLGTSNTIVIFSTQKGQIGSRYMNVAMYYTIMSPKSFKAKNQLGITTSYTGKSELLDISTTLPKSVQSYQISYPENVAGATSYNLGGSANFSSKGVTAGITASTTITKNRLEITNKSDVDSKKYRVVYDYKTALVGTDSSNSYLKNQTTQRGTFYYLTDGNSFKFPVTIKTSFGYYCGIYCYGDVASKTTTWKISLGS